MSYTYKYIRTIIVFKRLETILLKTQQWKAPQLCRQSTGGGGDRLPIELLEVVHPFFVF
jgi:hypothetical protein